MGAPVINIPWSPLLRIGSIALAGFHAVYFLQIYLSGIPISEASFFLSLGYPSDPLYLPFIARIEHLAFFGTTVFPTLGVTFELLISKYFNFQYIWFMVPTLKAFCVGTIFALMVGRKRLPSLVLIVLFIFLFIIFTTNSFIFGDRFSRPHLIPTFALVAMLGWPISPDGPHRAFLFVSGALSAVVFAHDAWLFACMAVGGLVYFSSSARNWKSLVEPIFFIGIGFCLVTLFANLRYFFGESAHPLYLHFVGLKYIFNPYNFIIDYYSTILSDKGFILRFGVAVLIGSICKDKRFLWAMLGGSLFAFIPFIVVGHVVQAYHVIIAAKTFILICTLLSLFVYLSESYYSNRFSNIKVLAVIVLVGLTNYHSFKSPMVNRASSLYFNYSDAFSRLSGKKDFDPSCVVISNDIYVRAYTLAFTEYPILPRDGLYVARSMREIQAELLSAIKAGRNHGLDPSILSGDFVKKGLHYAAHNYFSVSNSFAPPILKGLSPSFAESQLDANSYLGWQMRYPESLVSSLTEATEVSLNKAPSIGGAWFFIKNSYQYSDASDLIEYNKCSV